MRDVIKTCAAHSFYPQLNSFNLVLMAKGKAGPFLQEPQVKLAGVEFGCYYGRNASVPIIAPAQKARSEMAAGAQAPLKNTFCMLPGPFWCRHTERVQRFIRCSMHSQAVSPG